MLKEFETSSGKVVFGKGDFTYQCVLDDFSNAKFIGIITFNISPKSNSNLLAALKSACQEDAEAVIITNIPKRFSSYFQDKYAVAAKGMIDLYTKLLNPEDYGINFNPYFYFHNHAKVIMTDNIIYWGSSNFSDESSSNFECGTISTDKELIEYVKNVIFPELQEQSVPYYEYDFAVAIANVDKLILVCEEARNHLFEAAFEPWSDYDTNFEEEWVYRTTDSGITVDFLRHFVEVFSQFEDALTVIDTIIAELWEYDELPEEVQELKTVFEEYKESFDTFYTTITNLFDDLKDMANYDVSEEACRKTVDDYGMVAYDEDFDHYVGLAMQEAESEYGNLINNAESTVKEAIEELDEMVTYFEKIKQRLHQLLVVNKKIDNTNVQ